MHASRLPGAPALCLLALLLTSPEVLAEEPDTGGLRDDSPPRHAPWTEPEPGPDPESEPTPSEPSPPSPEPATSPQPEPERASPAAVAPNQLEADIWLETWFNRSIDIHKVLADGERGRKTAKLFYNFSVEAYVRDTSEPFHYVIQIDGIKVSEGDATFHLNWVTSVEAESWNVTLQLTQAGKTRIARWERIVGVPGEDAGIGERPSGEAPVPTDITVPRTYITRLTWTIVLGNIAMMVASFVVVGGVFLEKVQRMGWQRWMG